MSVNKDMAIFTLHVNGEQGYVNGRYLMTIIEEEGTKVSAVMALIRKEEQKSPDYVYGWSNRQTVAIGRVYSLYLE